MRWKHKDSLLRHRYNLCRITGKYPDGTPVQAATDSEIGEALRNCTALDSELTRAAFKYHYLQEIGRLEAGLRRDYDEFTFGDLKTDAKQQALIALHGAGYLRKVQRIRQNRRYVWQWKATSKFWRKFGHDPIEG